MQVDYSFLEYSYNPELIQQETVEKRLNTLGFTKRTRNTSGAVTVWTQNLCILVLKEVQTDLSGITGIGFNAKQDVIDKIGAMPDKDDTGMYVIDNCAGLRTLLMSEDDFKDLRKSLNYTEQNATGGNENGLGYVSGIIYNCTDARMRDFYQEIGFRFTKTGDRYYTFMSANNRFSILMDMQKNDGKVPSIICDTDDVFNTTANFVSNKVPLKQFDINPNDLDFGEMNHRIMGYNCNADGNDNSYTIENLIPEAAPNLDIIFRQRKQYLNISETTLDTYYDASDS